MRAMRLAALFCLLGSLAVAAEPGLTDFQGRPLDAPGESDRAATAVFFVMSDCPISNVFAPEINRICDDYEGRDVQCYLAYVDPELTAEQIGEHRTDYGHRRPVIHDRDQELVRRAGATITPEVAVFDRSGEIAYRGRINNFYAKLGVPRRKATVHDLRDALDAVIAGRPVETARTEAVGCYIPDLSAYKDSQ